jgi:hypothetical protein
MQLRVHDTMLKHASNHDGFALRPLWRKSCTVELTRIMARPTARIDLLQSASGIIALQVAFWQRTERIATYTACIHFDLYQILINSTKRVN